MSENNNAIITVQMQEKVKNIMSSIFDIHRESITEDTSPDTVEGWDSFRHMTLVTALEEEFEIEFTDNQIPKLLNYKVIVDILQKLSR